MNTYQTYLSALGGLLQLFGFIPYAYAIVRGETKPKKVTWLIWGTVDAILFAGMYAAHTLNGQMIAALTGVFAIVGLAFVYGEKGWTKIDIVCFVGGIIGIVLWVSFSSPVLAIITSCAVLWIGAIPTFENAWLHPEREDKFSWTVFTAAGVCTVAGIPALTLADTVQPLTFFLTDALILAIVLIREKKVLA